MNVLDVSMSLKKRDAHFKEALIIITKQKSYSWLKKGKNNGISNFTCSDGHDGLVCVLSVSCSKRCRISTHFGFYLLLNRGSL